MKSILFFSLTFLIFFSSGCATMETATQEEMTHEYIVEYPGISKDVIFTRTQKWIANNFKSAKQVIEYQDKDAGIIVGNGITEIKATGALSSTQMSFTLNIDIKDNKARYRFINLSIYSLDLNLVGPMTSSYKPMGPYSNWHNGAKIAFDIIVSDLEAAIEVSDDF